MTTFANSYFLAVNSYKTAVSGLAGYIISRVLFMEKILSVLTSRAKAYPRRK
jgi:hypothetical protein